MDNEITSMPMYEEGAERIMTAPCPDCGKNYPHDDPGSIRGMVWLFECQCGLIKTATIDDGKWTISFSRTVKDGRLFVMRESAKSVLWDPSDFAPARTCPICGNTETSVPPPADWQRFGRNFCMDCGCAWKWNYSGKIEIEDWHTAPEGRLSAERVIA